MKLSNAFLFAGAASAANVYCSNQADNPVEGIDHSIQDFAISIVDNTPSAGDIVNASKELAGKLDACMTVLTKSGSKHGVKLRLLGEQFGRIGSFIHDILVGKDSTIQWDETCADMGSAVDTLQAQFLELGNYMISTAPRGQKKAAASFTERILNTLEETKLEIFARGSCGQQQGWIGAERREKRES
ncbi:hypothetical protein RJ55_07533 [Drechmeria coniospora]|nr:hypothetical protein RJ55_07533 [Drechmeria coniospora]